MKNKCVILVDNSNIFIGGRKVSAQRQNMQGEQLEAGDPSWRIDFGNLLSVLSEGRPIHRAILVGSRPPFADAVWKAAEREGFEVIVHDRNSRHQEKAIDTELVARGTEIVCECETPGVLIVASGDADLLPLIVVAKEHGWRTEMWAFRSSFNPESELCQTVDRVQLLDDFFGEIGDRADEAA
jgi:uncharacterized LabA/DUF88 family protein